MQSVKYVHKLFSILTIEMSLQNRGLIEDFHSKSFNKTKYIYTITVGLTHKNIHSSCKNSYTVYALLYCILYIILCIYKLYYYTVYTV